MYKEITLEKLKEAVAANYSVAGALKALGRPANGGGYKWFYRAVGTYNVDTSHFTGKIWSKNPNRRVL